MIQRVELDHFKAFERFALTLRGDAFLAGPNNAGKSTLIAVVRTAARMLAAARRRGAGYEVLDKGRTVSAHVFAARQFGLVEENIRHEFRNEEARFGVRFRNGTSIYAVWPPDTAEQDAFFYVLDGDIALRHPADVKASLPTIGVVPVLTPIDHQERVLSPEHVRENMDGRLTSRHFRNQLYLLSDGKSGDDLDAFFEFAEPWLPEMTIRGLTARPGEGGLFLDLFFKEVGSPNEKELFWAGDGLQIWFQLLLHLFRLRESESIVLDEPDVFLHPDLQRRLVRLLEHLETQAITATHSPELLAEAPPESVVWVDKSRRRSVSAPNAAILSELVNAIGTQFNIRLARALRAHTVLFVEGDDMKMLRHLASAVGATSVAREVGVAVIPLRGYSNWDRIEPFVWLVRDLLENAVSVFVFLDRDYRTDAQVSRVQERLATVDVRAHVWRRKELESYLLEPDAMARINNFNEAKLRRRLDAITSDMQDDVIARCVDEEARFLKKARSEIEPDVRARIETIWSDTSKRLHRCPAKDVFTSLNRSLQADGLQAFGVQRLARAMTPAEIADEIKEALLAVEEATQTASIPRP